MADQPYRKAEHRVKAPTLEKTPVILPPSNSYSSASSKASTVARSKGLSKKTCPTQLCQKATKNGYRGSLKKVSDSRSIGKLKNHALRVRLNAEVFKYIASTESENISLPNLSTEEYYNDHNLDNSENESTSNIKHMFHIHYGISVPYKNWKKALKAKSDYGFLRELIDYIWDPHIFLKKSIQPQRAADKESREKVTPKKKKP
ncbi:hypothetical protein TKK_0015398 [Trichogramma kaykai]